MSYWEGTMQAPLFQNQINGVDCDLCPADHRGGDIHTLSRCRGRNTSLSQMSCGKDDPAPQIRSMYQSRMCPYCSSTVPEYGPYRFPFRAAFHCRSDRTDPGTQRQGRTEFRRLSQFCHRLLAATCFPRRTVTIGRKTIASVYTLSAGENPALIFIGARRS